MKDIRYAIHPSHFKELTTDHLRKAFLVDTLFDDDNICATYTHYDRLIIGGVKPISKSLTLPSFDSLKADFFLQRREIGIINVGGNGKVS